MTAGTAPAPLSPATETYAQVVVLAQLGRAGGLYTYRVPPEIAPEARPGALVQVPFGSRQLQGVVWSVESNTDLPRVRDVAAVVDPDGLPPHLLRLARWIADYYAASLSDVLGGMLPPALDRTSVTILSVHSPPTGRALTPVQAEVYELVAAAGRIPSEDVVRAVGEKAQTAIRSLTRRGVLQAEAELSEGKVTPRTERVVHITDAGREAASHLHRAPRQREILERLLAGPLPAHELGAPAAVAALQKRGMIVLELRPIDSGPAVPATAPSTPLDLSPPQRAAYRALGSALHGKGGLFLLHGVTGSGKTEVYLQVAADAVRAGKGVVMMVPEISLTPQMLERVASRFPGRVAVLHSKLSPRERLAEWRRIRSGDVDVVVGPRSALFAPLPRPGLIVVDEEHDPSYKQDSSPRYHARDAAAVLGRMLGLTVVLGSATPDVVTYSAAVEGRIALLEMPDRPQWGTSGPARPMPDVEVVDMRQELKAGNRSIFSAPLLDGLDATLAAGHQALLFLNRRGSATVVLCRDCGWVVRCSQCDIPYTYHAAGVRMICHRCDSRAPSPRTCPRCSSPRIRYLGVGTQRVEEEVARLFPRARVLRWDRDVTGGKDAHERILQRFARREADILVGTQMIAKGLDFPAVTLVGVISADTGLHMPDFRAPERSFQLLTQVAGRAGRSSLPSRVVVQTYTPDHYAVTSARHHDYRQFYADEMSFRQAAGYPPYARLIRLVYSAPQEAQCEESGRRLRDTLEPVVEGTPVEILGPAPAFVGKSHGRYHWHMILRGPDMRVLRPLLDYVPSGWAVDVDPVDLL